MRYLLSGTPTVELFAASFNNRANKSTIIPIKVEGTGYVVYKTSYPFAYEENFGIYSKNDKRECWTASPGSDTFRQVYVSYDNSCRYFSDASDVRSHSIWVRPVVCILTSVFDSKYVLANE